MRYFTVFCVIAALAAAMPAGAANLLKNPGFEDPAGWSTDWTIKDANGGNLTYHYHLTAQRGGHGNAVPRTGAHAVEIYSSDRQTYLAQKVTLQPGVYRLSAWARTNNTPDYAPVQLKLGEKTAVVPLISERYKPIWADFKVEQAGEYEVSFLSQSYGIALDDLALEPLTSPNTTTAPVLAIDLFPSSKDRSANIQYCLKGTRQWVNFAVSCFDAGRLKQPVMRILAAEPVRLSGLNEMVIRNYRMREDEDVKVKTDRIVRNGRTYHQSSFPLPRFVSGYDKPLSFGGFWLSNVPKKDGQAILEIVDGDVVLASETLTLVPVDPPKKQRTPRRYYTIPYAVQNWQQSGEDRLKALPGQFKMMGFNVWSDYGLSAEKPAESLTAEEKVLKEAYENYGIRQFWPNFSSMMEVQGGGCYSDASGKAEGKDMYLVGLDGVTRNTHYNFNYSANKGKAWMGSSIAAWTRTQKRPAEMGLPFRYSGFINDSLEGMPYSYDPSTLAAFAKFKGVDSAEVKVEKLQGEWKQDWLLFNMDLYTRVVDVWAEEMRKVDPNVKVCNTAGTYGPGGFEQLSAAQQMKWARSADYNMPQWYASNYYGTAYSDQLRQGDREKVFGKQNGGVDVIPVLYLSMGGPLEFPEALRFKIIDQASESKSIKGFSYYIGTYAFSDAKFMVELSKAHTLLANVEDYYAGGVRDDGLVKLTTLPDNGVLIPGMDLDGQQTMVKPQVSNNVRVHKLNKKGRIALITVITYSEQGKGSKLALDIDSSKLPGGGKGLMMIDHLTGARRPFSKHLTIDTSRTKNLAVIEITTGAFGQRDSIAEVPVRK